MISSQKAKFIDVPAAVLAEIQKKDVKSNVKKIVIRGIRDLRITWLVRHAFSWTKQCKKTKESNLEFLNFIFWPKQSTNFCDF